MQGEFKPSPMGHNSAGQIKAFVERLMRLEDDQAALGEDIRELKKEAKGQGFNPKILAAVAKMMRKDRDKVRSEREEVDLYLQAMGWLD